VIDVTACGLAGRRLEVDAPRRFPLHGRHTADIDRFPLHYELRNSELQTRIWDQALESSAELFARFDWNPGMSVLRSWQEDIRKHDLTER
jgi:hypothetical protein